ncbi:MAG: site-specific integrase [Bacteroidota bacterium]
MLVSDFVALAVSWAVGRYVKPDGTPTGQAANLEIALRWWTTVPKNVDDVTLEDLKEYRAYLVDDRGLQSRTVNQYVGWVRGVFRWGAEEGHVAPRVPAEFGVLRPLPANGRRPSHTVPALDAEALLAVAKFLDGRGRAGDAMRVQWLCAARPAEVRAMDWAELELQNGYGLFRPTRHKVEHFGIDRLLVLVPEAVAHLGDRGEGRVFTTRDGRPFSASWYANQIGRACTALGMDRITPGMIRRGAATAARALGGTEAAQRLLGHTSAAMTEDYYSLGWMDTVADVQRLERLGWTLERPPR